MERKKWGKGTRREEGKGKEKKGKGGGRKPHEGSREGKGEERKRPERQ